jgi:hypothetical protein
LNEKIKKNKEEDIFYEKINLMLIDNLSDDEKTDSEGLLHCEFFRKTTKMKKKLIFFLITLEYLEYKRHQMN